MQNVFKQLDVVMQCPLLGLLSMSQHELLNILDHLSSEICGDQLLCAFLRIIQSVTQPARVMRFGHHSPPTSKGSIFFLLLVFRSPLSVVEMASPASILPILSVSFISSVEWFATFASCCPSILSVLPSYCGVPSFLCEDLQFPCHFPAYYCPLDPSVHPIPSVLLPMVVLRHWYRK